MIRTRKIPGLFVRNPAYRQAFQRLDETLEQNAPLDNSEKIELLGRHIFGDLWYDGEQTHAAVLPE